MFPWLESLVSTLAVIAIVLVIIIFAGRHIFNFYKEIKKEKRKWQRG